MPPILSTALNAFGFAATMFVASGIIAFAATVGVRFACHLIP